MESISDDEVQNLKRIEKKIHKNTKPLKIKKDLRDKKKQRHTGIIIDGVKEDSDVILVLKDSEFKRLVIYDSDLSKFQKGQKIDFETYQHSKHVVRVLE